MPWSIIKNGDRFCVVEDSTGDTVKCHPTREKALAHQRALYVNVPDARPKADWEAVMAQVIDEFDTQWPFKTARVRLEPAGRSLEVAVADSDETRARGMAGRTFDGFEAMLFTYPTDVQHAFHNDGVDQHLHIAFFAADGRIVDHLGMFRLDPYHHRSQRPFRYALELPVDPRGSSSGASGSPWSWLDGQTLHIEETPDV